MHAGNDDLPGFAWSALTRAGARISRDGVTIEAEVEQRAELQRRAEIFRETRLALYRTHGWA
jgi:hypothetical protein